MPNPVATGPELTDLMQEPTAVATRPHAGGTAVSVASAAYVPEVDAMRGLAMTAVIAMHCGLLPFGWMGVWLFFVVSGFSVTTSLLNSQRYLQSRRAMIWHFYMRRAMRIWPLYFIYIGANVALLLAAGDTRPLREIPWLCGFVYNIAMILRIYGPGPEWPGFAHLWTLSVEQQFYLLFPWLILTSRAVQHRVLFGILVVAPIVRAGVAVWAASRGWAPEHIAFAVYAFGPAHFDAFAAGALIAMYRRQITANRALTIVAFLVAGLFTLAYVAFYLEVGVAQSGGFSVEAMRNIVSGIAYGQGREVFIYFIPTCFGSAFLMGILTQQRLCLWLCRLPGLQAAGRISFGGYVLHVPALIVTGSLIWQVCGPPLTQYLLLSHVLLFAIGFPLAMAAAWLSFVCLERPFLRLRSSYR